MNEDEYKDIINHWFLKYYNKYNNNANLFIKELLMKSNIENPNILLAENIRELVLMTELITIEQLMQYSRKRNTSVLPRQIYAHLLIKYVKTYSLQKLGTFVRKKPYTHCDMIHCNNVINNLCTFDQKFKNKMDYYYRIIESWKI